MSMMRWNPFRDLESIREAMDRALEETYWPTGRRSGIEALRVLPVDMYETDSDVIVRTAVPGVKPEDIQINVTGNLLSIRAERKEEEQVKRENVYRHEIHAGQFYRELALPTTVNADQAEATFANGVLTLRLPKTEQAKARKIEVKSAESPMGRQTSSTQQRTQH